MPDIAIVPAAAGIARDRRLLAYLAYDASLLAEAALAAIAPNAIEQGHRRFSFFAIYVAPSRRYSFALRSRLGLGVFSSNARKEARRAGRDDAH